MYRGESFRQPQRRGFQMSIVPTIIVAGVSLLFLATAVAPMVIEAFSKRPARPELTVLHGGYVDAAGDHQPHAA
jgi:hypothetical protein